MSKKKDEKQSQALTPEEMVEIAILQEELNLLKKEQGIVEEKKGACNVLGSLFQQRNCEDRRKVKKGKSPFCSESKKIRMDFSSDGVAWRTSFLCQKI